MQRENRTFEPALSDDATSLRPRQIHEQKAVIGPSLRIKGTLSGEEDLLILGRVEGEITLGENDLTVGTQGRLDASAHARVINVEGEVCGDLCGRERIVIRETGDVRGDLVAPRVSLADGATFKGSVSMESEESQENSALPRSEITGTRAAKRSKGSPGKGRTSKTAEAPADHSPEADLVEQGSLI